LHSTHPTLPSPPTVSLRFIQHRKTDQLSSELALFTALGAELDWTGTLFFLKKGINYRRPENGITADTQYSSLAVETARMRRETSLLLIILVVTAGCNVAQPPTTSPFEIGRLVPPPATGAVKTGSSAAGNPAWAIDNRPGQCPTAPLAPPPEAAAGQNTATGPRQSVVQQIPPRRYDSGGTAAPLGPATRTGSSQSRQPVEILDLPPANRSSSKGVPSSVLNAAHHSSTTQQAAQIPCGCGTGQVQQTEYTTRAQTATPEARAEATVDATGRFAYSADYSWLRGRLEYSQLDRSWKLRYVRAGDAVADSFGGSVIIADPRVLDGIERGDIIEIHGQLGGKDRTTRGYSPVYFVDEIRMIARAN